jgi:hypothetical protein
MKLYSVYALSAILAIIGQPAFAKGKSVSISQHGLVNAAVVGEIGNNSTAHITQTGVINGAVVGQIGNNEAATVSQLGHINVSSITQGP